MKKSIFILHISCFFLILIFCFSCLDRQSGAENSDRMLKSVYHRLGYTKLGKEYPDQELLETWKQNNYESKTYQHVQNAKQELLAEIAHDPEKTLSFTLDTIDRQCNQDTDKINTKDEAAALDVELECVGAFTALFFFNKQNQDKTIMNRLLTASPQVLGWLSGFRYEWIYNRPDSQRWIESIERIPDNKLSVNQKATIIQNIKDARRNTEKFGVMLGNNGAAQ